MTAENMKENGNEVYRILAEYIVDEELRGHVERAYDVLKQVGDSSQGHGVTLVLMGEGDGINLSRIKRHLEHTRPYNGTPHGLYDGDIADVIERNRDRELATVVDSSGNFISSGFHLPGDAVDYVDRYGIGCKMYEFLGYKEDEHGPGSRTISTLCSSEQFGPEVAIVTLGKSGEISIYYCGDRLYNSAGRKIQWDKAVRLPSHKQGQGNEERYDETAAMVLALSG